MLYCIGSIRKVTEDTYWIGSNDRRLALFENIFPIPRGVSYNSYFIDDEKTVVIDAVDWAVTPEYIENIKFLLNGRTLDYLIVHHMEPDHCSSIMSLLQEFPNLQIISTEKGFMIMRQLGYDIENHKLEIVKEGDTRNFGKHTLAFVEAPMVHWPEVIMSLDVTTGVLFSADAFGSFIANDGKLFADEVNFDRDYLDEARRYYTNIVGKYGTFVQSVLEKATPLLPQVKFICPLHGLVWRKDFGYLLEKYTKWATYEPEEKGILIVFASMYGNTENAAQAVATKLAERGITNTRLYDVSNTHFSYLIAESFRFSHIVLASATYNLGIYPVMKNFIEDMKALNLQNRTIALMENGSWACKAGDLMEEMFNEMKLMDVLDERLTMYSALKDEAELERFVNSIVESMN